MSTVVTLIVIYLAGVIVGYRIGLSQALTNPVFARGFIAGFGLDGLKHLFFKDVEK